MAKGKKGFQPGNRIGVNSRFSRDRQPHKRGRKPSLYRSINLPGEELSKEDFTHLMLSILECPVGQLEKIRKECKQPGSKIPVWVANLIAAIFSDIRRGRIDCLRWVLDRSFGKPGQILGGSQQINFVQNNVQIFNFSALSDTELVLFHSLLLKMEGKTAGIDLVNPDKLEPD
jgi:hypothetical protein